jgi:hypothetical protein
MHPGHFLAALLLQATLATAATACPWCQTEVGRQVGAQVFDADFLSTAALLALPFPVLLAFIALMYFWPGGKQAKHVG